MNTIQTFSFQDELRDAEFGDRRLNARAGMILDRIYESSDLPTNARAQSWAEAMGSYRFFSNAKVEAQAMIEGHQYRILERAKGERDLIIASDTTSVSYSSHPHTAGMGSITNGASAGAASGAQSMGLFIHTAEVFNGCGVPIGILGQEIWARGKKSGPSSRSNESQRWARMIKLAADLQGELPETRIYCVSDRESDSDENIQLGQQYGVRVITRAKSRMRAEKGGIKIVDKLRSSPAQATISLEFRDNKAARKRWDECSWRRDRQVRFNRTADLEIRYQGVTTRSGIEMWAVLVDEPKPPKNVEPVNWLLLSAFPVSNLEDAKKVIDVYRQRWGIEIFHKVLKSGCRIKNCRFDSFEKIKKYLTAASLVAWRLQMLTMQARENPKESCESVLTENEWKTLQAVTTKKITRTPPTLEEAILMIARLGGHFNRTSDAPPGVQTMWRGWQRLSDMTAAVQAMSEVKEQHVYNR